MTQRNGNRRATHLVGFIATLAVFLLSACASTDKPAATEAAAAESGTATESAPASTEPQIGGAFGDDGSTSTVAAASEQSLEDVPEIVESPRVVESCKKEPYIKYEESARNSIKKGWEATKAEKFGVGFKNADEYKQWSTTHNTLFKQVTAACESLSKCAKANKKDKEKKCAEQARAFSGLQRLAKDFSVRVKEVETSQVDRLCSLKPSLNDPARCFDALADNVRSACKSDECKELAQCWQNIYFMDAALRQAESSCKFARQKLSQCRGYSEQIARRKEQLKRCSNMHEAVNIAVMPVL